ncbi:MAG: acyl-CoA reductase [Bacteroidia bacterium]|nr:acyl-CoA reductase [Bacteroidia bacterium]
MKPQEIIESFVELGIFFSQFEKEEIPRNNSPLNVPFYSPFNELIKTVEIYNAWFTERNTRHAVFSWAELLTEKNLNTWISGYNISEFGKRKKIGVVMAGNIPMVGFHDMLSVLITGNIFIGKPSSKDDKLLKFVTDILIQLNPHFSDFVHWEDQYIKGVDAIIATGSNNTSKYFEYYFGKYPHIIRKNRNSVAILTGDETDDELRSLADDIFLYFGLGCRNVSKIFVPEHYDFNRFFESIEHYNFLRDHNKYANNYEYNRAIFLVNGTRHLDNGFVLIKEDTGLSSPIAVVYNEFYNDFEKLRKNIIFDKDNIQCIVSKPGFLENSIQFGKSQKPELRNYADNVNTLDFILNS